MPFDGSVLTDAERAAGGTGRPAVPMVDEGITGGPPNLELLDPDTRERFYRRNEARQSANGTGHPPESQSSAPPGQPQTSTEIIRVYLTERYQPVYREAMAIRCRDGCTVAMGTACAVPTSALIDRLAVASDAPRYQDGRTKRDALPAQFRRWAPVAWGDLLESLPSEDAADLGDLVEPAEELRRLVRAAMLSTLVLGETIGRDREPTRTERRSLIDWCYRFARPGPWRSIRSYRCWCRTVDRAGGEIELRVAVRHELFAQLHADRRLIEMGATKFARRAKRYGIGTSNRADRPHGLVAIVLDRELVSDLTAGLADADTDPGTVER
jgi:hypothetical protein